MNLINAHSSEIAKIVHDYIERGIGTEYDFFNSPPPPIPIRPVKVKSLKERLEETKMNATSTETFKDIIAIDFELQTFPNEDDKFIVSATNRDDIFCFVFEGSHLADTCRKAGLFTGWEKDQEIKELKETIKNLEHADMLDKEAADYWSKEHDTLSKRFAKLQEENKKLKDKVEHVEPFRSLERTIKEKQQLKEEYEDKIEDLQHKYNLEKAANEAQRKFIKEYAGKGTEIEFNYAIGDDDEDTYVIVNKEEYKALKNIQNNVKDNGDRAMIHGEIYTTDQLIDRVLELEEALKFLRDKYEALKELKSPTIENFADEEPSSRRDILRCAEKCVCGQREQDYGTPESNFQLIADLWNGYLGGRTDNPVISVTPVDVSMMMALMKIARIRNGGGTGDSFVDLAGYAACGGEIWAGEKKQ